jgi:surfactin synthase thioesterase subunit
MRELLLPILRGDVEMHENYKPVSDVPLTIPITSLRGTGDALVSAEEAAQWRQATSGSFDTAEIPGEHMYLVDSPVPLLETLARTLR